MKLLVHKRLLSWVCFGTWNLQTFLLSACYVWSTKQNIFQLQTHETVNLDQVKRSSEDGAPEVDCVYTTALQEFVLYSCFGALPGQESQAGLSLPKLEVLSASTGYNSSLRYFTSQYRLFFMQPQEQDVTSQNRPSSSATPEAHSFFALRRYHAELFSCLMHQVSATAASSRPEVTTAAANTPQDGDEWHGWIYSEARLWVKMWFQASKGFLMSLANTCFLFLNEIIFGIFSSHVFFYICV